MRNFGGSEPIDENPLSDLTAFQRDLLFTVEHLEKNGTDRELAEAFEYDAPSGTCVKTRIEGTLNKEINHGRLYPNLDNLVNKGLVVKGSLDRRTNSYTLTKRGKNALEEYRQFVGGE